MNLAILKGIGFSFLLFAISFYACNKKEPGGPSTASDTAHAQIFQRLEPSATGIAFQNGIHDDNDINAVNFSYLYIGGAVAVGDINNDGLQDLFFVSTQGPDKLYLNKGKLRFEDITEKAGVAGNQGIKMGVTMADVNADGYLDIYVCRTGLEPSQRTNFLYINNKNLTFTESARKYGLDDQCASNHANFFDYDLDGDLDLYLMNHPDDFNTTSQLRLENANGVIRRSTAPATIYESDRLYRNNGNGSFTDVSQQAGIVNRAFGLSCTVTDINHDGYPDIYIGNDYIEPDILYVNNRNGTFSDQINRYFRHFAHFTMGSDFADINNDGLPDFVSMDMLPEGNERRKLLATAMVNTRYNTLVQYGYGHQIMRNMLQLNNGSDFSDIGVMAGISATDWSWGPLVMDFDNDTYRDIFIANGILRDFTNNDYISFTLDSVMQAGGVVRGDINELIKKIPSVKVRNYMYHNNGDLTFADVSDAWGFGDKTFSNGSAFADLDNDGDLEIIVNNVADPAGIYENLSDQRTANHYLQLTFGGIGANPFAVGAAARVLLDNGQVLYQELTPTHGGFLSSQPYLIHFGLGSQSKVKRLEVRWPDGKVQTLNNVKADQRLAVKYADARTGAWAPLPQKDQVFKEVDPATLGIDFVHKENAFVDYNREFLIPHNLSALGPCIATGDVNGDGLEDFFVGGAEGQAGALFQQTTDGKFKRISQATWEADKAREDMGAVLFDADGDNDLDLYVVSGGNTHAEGDAFYQDRLYINQGGGNFVKAAGALPAIASSGSCVTAADFDKDGDPDLFVGGRVVAGAYPTSPVSYILKNEKGKFTDVTAQVAPTLQRGGMITAIQLADLDQDGADELLVTGEWLPIQIFKMTGGQYRDATAAFGMDKTNGWWNTLLIKDMDDDGDLDIVGGNLGLNTRLKASLEAPLEMYAKDFDHNGKIDPLISCFENGKRYPLPQRDLLVAQIPSLKKRFLRYANYADATIEDLYSTTELQSAMHYIAYNLHSTYFENKNGAFTAHPLPVQAQVAPIYKIISRDFNRDDKADLLLVGNDYGTEVETARYDASDGLLLLGDGKGRFNAMGPSDSGFKANLEARDLTVIPMKNGKSILIVANSDNTLQIFKE